MYVINQTCKPSFIHNIYQRGMTEILEKGVYMDREHQVYMDRVWVGYGWSMGMGHGPCYGEQVRPGGSGH